LSLLEPWHVAYLRLSCVLAHRSLLSFPTRRSSDLLLGPAFSARRSSSSCTMSGTKKSSLPNCDSILPTCLIGFETSTIKKLVSRSEEHTSELQSRENLVCRLLLEKKKKTHTT